MEQAVALGAEIIQHRMREDFHRTGAVRVLESASIVTGTGTLRYRMPVWFYRAKADAEATFGKGEHTAAIMTAAMRRVLYSGDGLRLVSPLAIASNTANSAGRLKRNP